MTEASASERVVVELSLPEAIIVSAALRQYEPYWCYGDLAGSPSEQLARIRCDIDAVIGKLRCAAAL